MPSIELNTTVPLPAAVLAPQSLKILQAIQTSTPPYGHCAKTSDLKSLGLPNIGLLSVPITVRVGRAYGAAPQRIDFGFSATDKTALFPTFAGSLRCDPDGPSRTTVWLIGEHTPPLGYVGAILDRSLLHNLAMHTLRPFLDTLAAAAQSAGRIKEHDLIRAERFNQ